MTDCKGVAAAAHGCFIAPQVPPLKPVAHPLHIHVCCFFTCVFRLAWAIAKLRLLHLFYCSAIAAPKACSTYILPTPLAIIEALVLRNSFDFNLVVTVSNVGAANHDLRFYIWVSHLFSCTVYFGEGTSSNRSFVVMLFPNLWGCIWEIFVCSVLHCNQFAAVLQCILSYCLQWLVCDDIYFFVKGFCLTEYCFDHFLIQKLLSEKIFD